MNYAQVVEICCRDLRRYLEYALKNAKGGVVTVKMRRLLRAELSWPDRAVKMRRLLRAELSWPDRVRYAHRLSYVLHRWRWKRSTYVIPRQEVEKLLETFDTLCASAKNAKPRSEPKPRRRKEEFVLISVAVPSDLLHAVDEYARQHGLPRSEVIRSAMQKLIEMRRTLEELDKARDGPLKMTVALRLPRGLLRDLDKRAASLKAARAALVRYAIYKLLQNVKQPAET